MNIKLFYFINKKNVNYFNTQNVIVYIEWLKKATIYKKSN